MKHSSAAASIRWLAVCACALLLPPATIHETTARQPDAQTPQQFFGFRIGTDGELARYPRILDVLPAPGEDDQPRQVSGARKNDDGESVRAGDGQRSGEPGTPGETHRHQPPAGGSARVDGSGSQEARARGPGLLFRLRDDPFNRGREYASAHRDRPPARDRRQRRDSTDARQRRAPRRAFTESGRPGARHRSLVQDEGHAVRAGVSGPLSQVRRT